MMAGRRLREGRMNIAESYDYLVRARRDLWAMLERVPDEVLSRPLLNGAKLHCIKDLLFHIASWEDFSIHKEILRPQPRGESTPGFQISPGEPPSSRRLEVSAPPSAP